MAAAAASLGGGMEGAVSSHPPPLLSSGAPAFSTEGGAGASFANPLHANARTEGADVDAAAPLSAASLARDTEPHARLIGFAAQATTQRRGTHSRHARPAGSSRKVSSSSSKALRDPAQLSVAAATFLLASPTTSSADVVSACEALTSQSMSKRELRAAGASLLPVLVGRLAAASSAAGDAGSAAATAATFNAMGSLSEHADSRTRAAMASAGVPALIVKALRDAADTGSPAAAPSLLSSVLWLLGNISRESTAAAGFIAAGGIAALLALLPPTDSAAPRRSDDTALDVCIALAPLAESRASGVALLDAGVLRALVACLPRRSSAGLCGWTGGPPPPPSLVEAACFVIQNLLALPADARRPGATCDDVAACEAVAGLGGALTAAAAPPVNASLAGQAAAALLAALHCAGTARATAGADAATADAVFSSAKGLAPVLRDLWSRCSTAAAPGAPPAAEDSEVAATVRVLGELAALIGLRL